MLSNLSPTARQLFWGNILLVGCCVFYLLWWLIAFKPEGAIKGVKSGWLLIPALLLGVAAVARIIQGSLNADAERSFFSGKSVLLIAAAAYVTLLVLTRILFHRQVTTELLLIVGWAALTFVEINTLYGCGILSHGSSIGWFASILIAAAVSMVCYILYYRLTDTAGYIDGMIPLLSVAVLMSGLSVSIVR